MKIIEQEDNRIERQQRRVAVLMIALQTGYLGYLSDVWLLPVLLLSLAALTLVVPHRFSVSRRERFWVIVMLFLILMMKHQITPQEYPFSRLFIRTAVAHLLALFLISIQVWLLFLRIRKNPRKRLSLQLPGLGFVALVLTADIKVSPEERFYSQCLVTFFVLVASLYYRVSQQRTSRSTTSETRRFLILGILATVVAGLAFSGSHWLNRYERDLEKLVLKVLRNLHGDPSRQIGFSGSASLTSVVAPDEAMLSIIALEIESDQPPGYLKGKTFETYRRSQWSPAIANANAMITGHPPETLLPLHPDENVFRIQETEGNETVHLKIWQTLDARGQIFTPLGTSHVKAQSPTFTISEHNDLNSLDMLLGPPYELIASPEVVAGPSPEMKTRLLRIPREMESDVFKLAGKIFEGCQTTEEKIRAVTKFFHENFRYHFGINLPINVDPLSWFLLTRPAAHCEYFASGAAVLLRLAEVPTRYVTGFIAVDQNAYSKQWIVRNAHAHAWVEAWDETHERWVIVEATPAGGLPTQRTYDGVIQQPWDFLKSWFHQLRVRWLSGGLRTLLLDLLFFFMTVPGMILIAAFISWYLWKNRERFFKHPTTAETTHRIRELQTVLNKLFHQLEKLDLTKANSETLHQFAARIETTPESENHNSATPIKLPAIANWIRRYASLRYQTSDVPLESQEEWQELLREQP